MMIDSLFPSSPLTESEEVHLKELFSSPVMIKYLRVLAMEDMKELAALSAAGKSESDLAIAHAIVNGKLAVISTFLSIATPTTKE